MRFAAIFVIVFQISTFSQEFGFGCFGLLGGFVGYEMQNYEPAGLNSYIDSYNTYYQDSLQAPLGKFRQLRGLRLGVNFFRHSFSGLLFTLKGHYSTLNEKNKATRLLSDNTKSIFNTEMRLQEIGLGFDIGMPITEELNWKLFDATFIYYKATFTSELNTSKGTRDNMSFTNKNNLITYGLGSGFIMNVIRNYVSLEGTVSYVNLIVVEMETGDKVRITKPVTNEIIGTKIIKSGGINLLIQLNIGLPM
ncbi:MAG: hypothetical protein HYV28_02215 [Ignavibacteriales bacterium]|nr:hypothetical protein [Ignavibacteriales bacterium]